MRLPIQVCRVIQITIAVGTGVLLTAEGQLKRILRTPTGWVKAGESKFIVKDLNAAFQGQSALLMAGHQPWRLVPENLAAECLMDFEVCPRGNVLELAKQLSSPDNGHSFFYKTSTEVFKVTIAINGRVSVPCELGITTR